jgi:hypothetical protein
MFNKLGKEHAMKRNVMSFMFIISFSVLPFLFTLYWGYWGRSVSLAGPSAQVSGTPIRLASDEESGYLVTVHGPRSGFCSGAPITGTNLVVTAAHCVVVRDPDAVGTRYNLRVERSGVRYEVLEVYADMSWEEGWKPEDDVAVLVMEYPIPGPGLALAEAFEPAAATLVGFQPASNGAWLRGLDYDSHIDTVRTTNHANAPAACSIIATSFVQSKYGHWWVPCGMVPGVSGGPLVVAGVSGPTLIGVSSSVDFDLEFNGVAPVEKVQYLLRQYGE